MAILESGFNFYDGCYIFIIFLIWFVAFPGFVYTLRMMIQDWNKLYLVKRHRSLVVVGLVCLFSFEFIYIFAICVESMLYGFPTFTFFYGGVVSLASIVIWIFINCTRIWLLYFDLNLSAFHLHRCWQTAIDPAVHEKNWFQNHEKTLGSASYLLKIVACAVVANIGLALLLRAVQSDEFYARIFTLLSAFVLTPVAAVVWCKLKSHHEDTLGIKQEMLYIIYSGFTLLVVGLGLILMFFYVDGFSDDMFYVGWYFMAWLYVNSCLVLMTYVPRKFSAAVINRKRTLSNGNPGQGRAPVASVSPSVGYDKIEEKSDLCTTFCACACLHWCTRCERGIQQDQPAFVIEADARWVDVVCNEYALESIMSHMERELALENILFVFEYVQVKSALMNEFEDIVEAVMKQNQYTRLKIEFPGDGARVPASQIATNLKDSTHTYRMEIEFGSENAQVDSMHGKDLKVAAMVIRAFIDLFDKYVSNSAEYMVNIDSYTRMTLQKMFGKVHFENGKCALMQQFEKRCSESVDGNESGNNVGKELNWDGQILWLLDQVMAATEKAVQQVSVLVTDSFTRFKQTKDFKKVLKIVSESQK